MSSANERVRIVASYCHGLNVLDIGSGEHSVQRIGQVDWLHAALCRVAERVVGVELMPELVDGMKQMGYTVVQGNAETFDLGETFDVVVAGELVEHVDNQLNMLLNLRKHVKDNGRLVITTPNCLSWYYMAFAFLASRYSPNREHTLWHDESTLRQIMSRAGFEMEKLYYTKVYPIPTRGIERLVFLTNGILMRLRPRMSPQMVAVFRVATRARTSELG